MIAEYSLAYGGPPDREMAWPMFMLLLSRANAVFARQLLAAMTGVGWGIGKGFGGKQTGGLDVMRRDVERVAFPGQPKRSVFALKQSKEEDDDG